MHVHAMCISHQDMTVIIQTLEETCSGPTALLLRSVTMSQLPNLVTVSLELSLELCLALHPDIHPEIRRLLLQERLCRWYLPLLPLSNNMIVESSNHL